MITRSRPKRPEKTESRDSDAAGQLSSRLIASNGIGLILAALLCAGCGEQDALQVQNSETRTVINELQSRNSTIKSDTGKKSDWVELHNPSDAEESLDGYFISDDSVQNRKGKLGGEALVPARGYLVLWLDDTEIAGTLHFPFKLSGEGDYFFLNDPAGHVVQSITIPPDPTRDDAEAPDVSYGAFPDGSETFDWCRTPTPGRPNAADCAADTEA